MKKITVSYSLLIFIILLVSKNTSAQVGINTTDPKGIVDFNSATLGVVYPNVALTGTDDVTTVVNPQGGSLAVGTTIYNTNTTSTGATTDVHPGIYVWDGSKWTVHYRKRQSELFTQTSVLRPEANFATDWQDVPGLGIGDNKTFTAKYSGLYRIEVKTYFGAGRTETNSSSFVSMASGQFRLQFDGTDYTFETSAFSAYTAYIGGGTYYEDIWKESYETRYVYLTAGDSYDFSLCFDAYDAPGFLGNGSTSGGGTDPTSVDLVNEDFEDPYDTSNQVQIPVGGDSDCSTDGWTTVTTSSPNSCASCSGKHLYIEGSSNNCTQNATAFIDFTPSVTTVDVSFDYRFRERSGKGDSFKAYIRNESTMATTNLVVIDNSGDFDTDSSYSGSISVVAGTPYTIRFEYINTVKQARSASVDNVVISELSGPPTPPSTEGRGYVGNELGCQIEITYIGE